MTHSPNAVSEYGDDRLAMLLRTHVDDVLLCEAEPHVIEDARAIVRAAADLINHLTTQSNAWQDMATAPRDGTLFLIFVPTAKARKVSMSRGGQDWIANGTYGVRPDDGFTALDDHGRPVKATHWQPLPAPPGDKA